MAEAEYREGDWFAVPLRNGGFGTGVIARMNSKGVLLGFFFGPKRTNPTADAVAGLTPDDAQLVRQFGHLGLAGGTWPILGLTEQWDSDKWVASEFRRQEPLTHRYLKEVYDVDDPNRHVKTVPITQEEADRLPRDGLSGPGAIEVVLTRLLG